jgi:hypothetical protein
VSERRYARRRRAAIPAALAAFTLLVVLSGARTPLTWAGGSSFTPAMTIVLPAQQVATAPAPAPAEPAAEPPGDPLALADPPATATPSPAGGDTSAGDGDTGGSDDEAPSDPDPADPAPPAVRHVFVVLLTQTDLVALAGDDATAAADPSASPAPYFATRLVPQGTLLTRYDSVARGSLANGVALLSGQGPTAQTLADCPTPAGAAPADVTPDVLGDDGQQLGDGCVYPFATGTMPDQLIGAGLDWRAYVEDAEGPCPATPRDPFAYFHSLLDAGACARRVAGLDALDADLARGSDAPALMYLVPGACHDGSPTPCAAGAPAGPAAADAFLSDVVAQILASPAYADGGLIAITSDGPPAPPPAQPAPSEPAPPAPAPTTPAPTPPPAPTPTTPVPAPDGADPFPATYRNVGDAAAAGAARVGALLISPAVSAGASSDVPANHFTLLRAISDLFALQPLGYAGATALRPLPERVLAPNEQ